MPVFHSLKSRSYILLRRIGSALKAPERCVYGDDLKNFMRKAGKVMLDLRS